MSNFKIKARGAASIDIPTVARIHCRADGAGADDAAIALALDGAIEACEHYAQRCFSPATIELALDEFPDGREIALPMGPITALTSVKYIDVLGVDTTLANTEYTLDDYAPVARVRLKATKSWPAVTPDTPACVRVLYEAGAATLTGSARMAVLMMTAHLFENREAIVIMPGAPAALPLGVRDLLDASGRVWAI